MRTAITYVSAFFFVLAATNSPALEISPRGDSVFGPTSHCHFLAILPERPKIRPDSSPLNEDDWWALLGAA